MKHTHRQLGLSEPKEFPCSFWGTGLEDPLFRLCQTCFYDLLFNIYKTQDARYSSEIISVLFHPRPLFMGLCLYWKSAWKEKSDLKIKIKSGKKNLRTVGTLVTNWHGDPFGHLHETVLSPKLRKASTHKSTFLGMSIHGLIFHLCSDIAAFLYWLALAPLVQNILGVNKVFPGSWLILANLANLLILVLALVADNLSANLSSVAL